MWLEAYAAPSLEVFENGVHCAAIKSQIAGAVGLSLDNTLIVRNAGVGLIAPRAAQQPGRDPRLQRQRSIGNKELEEGVERWREWMASVMLQKLGPATRFRARLCAGAFA